MKCIHCQGQMKRGTTTFHIDRKGYHVMLDSVPAWICQQCGEAYFDEGEVNAIRELIRSIEEKNQVISINCIGTVKKVAATSCRRL